MSLSATGRESREGPARIRNYLAEARYHIFICCFWIRRYARIGFVLEEYLQVARTGRVVCGGFIYPRKIFLPMPYCVINGAEWLLKFQSAGQRNKEPYNRFISMNFVICRDAFLKVRFDETFHLGYEMRFCLACNWSRQAGVEILHIDNPVYHLVEENMSNF